MRNDVITDIDYVQTRVPTESQVCSVVTSLPQLQVAVSGQNAPICVEIRR